MTRNGIVCWTSATYEVQVGKKKGTILRSKSGAFSAPSATPPLRNDTIRQAIDAALGRPKDTLPELVRNHRAPATTSPDRARTLHGHDPPRAAA